MTPLVEAAIEERIRVHTIEHDAQVIIIKSKFVSAVYRHAKRNNILMDSAFERTLKDHNRTFEASATKAKAKYDQEMRFIPGANSRERAGRQQRIERRYASDMEECKKPLAEFVARLASMKDEE